MLYIVFEEIYLLKKNWEEFIWCWDLIEIENNFFFKVCKNYSYKYVHNFDLEIAIERGKELHFKPRVCIFNFTSSYKVGPTMLEGEVKNKKIKNKHLK